MAAAAQGWVARATAPLARQVRPADATPVGRRRARAGLVVVAAGAAAAKSLLIADGRWSLGAQGGLVASVVVVTAVVLAVDVEPGDRRRRVLRALGLLPLEGGSTGSAGGTRRAATVFVPLIVSGTITGIGLLVRSEPGHLDGAALLDLVVLVAGAEELIYRGAVLALAHRSLPPIAAEVVTAVAFGLSHLGNDGGWARVAVPIGGGLAFSWLRHVSGSLAGPVAGHIATNLPGRVLAG